MKRILLCMLMLCLFVLAGCRERGSGSKETLTLTIWEDNKNISLVQEMAEEFARYYAYNYPNAPQLRFEIVPHSEKSAVEDLVLDGPAGKGPDVLAFVHDTLGSAVGGGHLAENKFPYKISALHSSEAVQAASIDGVVYGFPITSESQVLIYRKSKFSEEDVRDVEKILAKGKLVWDVFEGYYSIGLLSDAILYGEDGETTAGPRESFLNFKTPQAKANLVYLKENFKGNDNLIIPGATGGSTDIEGLSYFLSGSADAIIVAPYFWASAKEEFGSDVGMAPLPRVNGNEMRPFSGFKLYGVSRYSENPALAQELADFLVSEWAQALRFREKSLLPTVDSLRLRFDEKELTVDSWRKLEATKVVIPEAVLREARIFKESLDKSRTMPKLPRFAGFWHAYANNIKAFWEKEDVSAAELDEFLDNITKNL